MKSIIATLAATLTVAAALSGCSGSSHPVAEPAPTQTQCSSSREDLIAWLQAGPGDVTAMTLVGGLCQDMVDLATSEQRDGYCMILAPAASNAGYDVNADRPKRPRSSLIQIGPAC